MAARSAMQDVLLCCSACRVAFYSICCKPCRKQPVKKPQLDVICIGLKSSGKSSLLAAAVDEPADNVVPTTGFNIKSMAFENCILNVKELGGDDKVRAHWHRYYSNMVGVIYVLDASTSEEDEDAAKEVRETLHGALQHEALRHLPCIVFLAKQDVADSSGLVERFERLLHASELRHADGGRWLKLIPCTIQEPQTVKDGFSVFVNTLLQREEAAQVDFTDLAAAQESAGAVGAPEQLKKEVKRNASDKQTLLQSQEPTVTLDGAAVRMQPQAEAADVPKADDEAEQPRSAPADALASTSNALVAREPNGSVLLAREERLI